MSLTVRITPEVEKSLRKIKASLDGEYQRAAPSVQDFVTVGLQRLIRDWENPQMQPQLLEELLEHRKKARSKMGNRKKNNN